MGKAQERIEGVLRPGESIRAEAPFQPPKSIGSSGPSFAVAVTERRILFFKANAWTFGANTGKLVHEVPLPSITHVEMKKKHFLGIPVVQVDVHLADGDGLSMAASGIGTPKARRFASALQALVEAPNGQRTQE